MLYINKCNCYSQNVQICKHNKTDFSRVMVNMPTFLLCKETANLVPTWANFCQISAEAQHQLVQVWKNAMYQICCVCLSKCRRDWGNLACVNKMRAGQQQGPSAMSSETVTIKLYRDTDFSHTICGFDTMSGGRVKAKKNKTTGNILQTFL